MAMPADEVAGPREGERARRVGDDVPHLRDAPPPRTRPSRGKRSSCAAIDGRARPAAHAKRGPQAGDRDQARPPRVQGGAHQLASRRAGSRCVRSPVSAFSWIRAVRPDSPCGGGSLPQRPHAPLTPDMSRSASDALSRQGPPHPEPAHDAPGQPGRGSSSSASSAVAVPLIHSATPPPGGAPPSMPCPCATASSHGHERGPGRMGAQGPHVALSAARRSRHRARERGSHCSRSSWAQSLRGAGSSGTGLAALPRRRGRPLQDAPQLLGVAEPHAPRSRES